MRRWLVEDVMTTDVVTVDAQTPYKDIVAALARSAVSAVPVVDARRRVLGVVSEDDLLQKMRFSAAPPRPSPHRPLLEGRRRRTARSKASADLARDLMSTPAVVIEPDATIVRAVRTIDERHVRRLPVVDHDGRLVGVVARCDLLKVYLRSDESIRAEIVDRVLIGALSIEPDTIDVTVEHGVVTLAGTVDRRGAVGIVVRLARAVVGVVDVVDYLTYRCDETQRCDETRRVR